MDQTTFFVILGVVVLGVMGFIFYLKHAQTKPKKVSQSGLDMSRCLKASGGRDNLVSLQATGSKLTLHVKKVEAVSQEEWKQLGATGIVVSGQKVTVILGKISEAVANELTQALKS